MLNTFFSICVLDGGLLLSSTWPHNGFMCILFFDTPIVTSDVHSEYLAKFTELNKAQCERWTKPKQQPIHFQTMAAGKPPLLTHIEPTKRLSRLTEQSLYTGVKKTEYREASSIIPG